MAERVPEAKFVELPGIDHIPWVGDQDTLLAEGEEFLTGVRPHAAVDRVLATVLFTDIVGSTTLAAGLGDRRWRDILQSYYTLARREVAHGRSREIDTAGDGFFASFDGPARAIRCASALVSEVRPLGITVRAGLHTGECEVIGEKIGGIAVHIGARVAAVADPAKCWSPTQCAIWWRGLASASRTAGRMSSRVCPAPGHYSRSRSTRPLAATSPSDPHKNGR